MIAHKYITKEGWIPSPSEVVVGELIWNFADNTIWTKTHDNKIIKVGGDPSEGPVRITGDYVPPFADEWIILKPGNWSIGDADVDGYDSERSETEVNRREWINGSGVEQETLSHIYMSYEEFDSIPVIHVYFGSTDWSLYDGSSNIEFQLEVIEDDYLTYWFNANHDGTHYESRLFSESSDAEYWNMMLTVRTAMKAGKEVICRVREGGPQ